MMVTRILYAAWLAEKRKEPLFGRAAETELPPEVKSLFAGRRVMVTGAGGGLLRDVMINQVPMVLTRRIYALAALVGGGTYYVLQQYMDSAAASFIATAVVFSIRMLATKYHWNLPRAIE